MADSTPLRTNRPSENKSTDDDLVEKLVHLKIKEKTNVSSQVLTTFESSGLPPEYITKLLEAGFKEPTPIQAQSWPIAMQGKDIIAVSKTGSGKKLGFLIPAFIHLQLLKNDPKKGPTVLVLCPTADIATEVQTEALKFGESAGITTTCLRGEAMKVPPTELEGGSDVMVAIPEALINTLEKENISLKQVSYLVLYEANLMLSESVAPGIHKIVSHLPSKQYQTLVFTTAWPNEARDIASVLHDPFIVNVDEKTRGAVTDGISDLGGSSDGISDLGGSSGTHDAVVPKVLGAPAKKRLLVLSINGILADIVDTGRWYERNADMNFNGKSVFQRPFCDDFLEFCFANFEVGIWSSRNNYNTGRIVNYLTGDSKNKLLFCWDQSKCTTTGLKAKDNKNKPAFFKELKKIWEKKGAGSPWPNGQFTKVNTLLVDDSPSKGFLNPPYTGIYPEPYNFKNEDDNSLGVGGDLRLYLETLITADDVQCYVKNNPFGQPPMTESHPDWNYYLPAMRTYRNP